MSTLQGGFSLTRGTEIIVGVLLAQGPVARVVVGFYKEQAVRLIGSHQACDELFSFYQKKPKQQQLQQQLQLC